MSLYLEILLVVFGFVLLKELIRGVTRRPRIDPGAQGKAQELERRLSALEQELETSRGEIQRLTEEREFLKRLYEPKDGK